MEHGFCSRCEDTRELLVQDRLETYVVRDQEIQVRARVAVCPECGEDVPVDAFDEETLGQAFAKYRELRGLTTPEEMKALRGRYGLGVRPFSLLLGWGELTLYRYETGSIQDDAHESQIRMAERPENVRTLLEVNGHKLTPRQRETVENHVAAVEGEAETPRVMPDRFIARDSSDEFGGFVPLHLAKLREMMMYFCELDEVYPTKLNKLLFYADFLHFKNHGVSISGSPYLAFQRGPVPQHYEWIKADLVEGGELESEWVDWGDDIGGERLCPARAVDLSMFSREELETLRKVSDELGDKSGGYLQNLSHQEEAYCQTALRAMIPYGLALDLSL